MHCPLCEHRDTRVLDSRITEDGASVRRRRECARCRRRFTTYERPEETPLLVVKKGGRREQFQRRKILDGLLTACEKRPLSFGAIEAVAREIEQDLRHRGESEVQAGEIGQRVMERLRHLDEVAYVRFASVYKEFEDVGRFVEELKVLEESRVRPPARPDPGADEEEGG